MKHIHLYTLPLVFMFCTSCGQNQAKKVDNPPVLNDRNIHTQYEYADSIGKRLIIQNGFPKGGIKYTDPNGEDYVYAVFWTRVINETDNPLELEIDFPVNSYELPSLPGKYLKILLPPDTMTPDKAPMFNYGLTHLESFLDTNIHKPSSLKRSIHPKDSSGFYVVILSLIEGAKGAMRTGLSLKGQNLFYKISRIDGAPALSLIDEKEIFCGSINLRKFMLRKYTLIP